MKYQLFFAAAFTAAVALNSRADFFYDGSDTSPWTADRYPMNLFISGSFAATGPAYIETISSMDGQTGRPAAYNSSFYNWQGYQTPVNGMSGAWSYTGYVNVTASMLSGTYQPLATGIWAGTGSGSGYYCFEFLSGVSSQSYSATAQATSYVADFDDTTGLWSYKDAISAGVVVGQNTFTVAYNGVDTIYYKINGITVASQGPAITSQDPSVSDLSTAFLENYNFYGNGSFAGNNPWLGYTVDWSNLQATTSPVPEPGVLAFIGIGSLTSLLALRRRLV